MTRRLIAIMLSITVAALAGAASAKPALKDVEYVREGIIATGMAYEISQNCKGISPRYIRGISFLNSLTSHARSLGYSKDEVDAYTSDKTEKKRLEGVARDRLAALGASKGNDVSFCAVGEAEIAANSTIGRLLR